MDFSINFDFFLVFLNLYSNPYPKTKIFFELSNSKIAKDLKKTQTQTLTQILNKLKTQTQT